VGPMRATVQGSACSPHPDLLPQKVGLGRPPREDHDLLPQPSEGRGAPGDQLAPSQSPDVLDHLTHGRPRSKRRAPPGLRTVTPRLVHRALIWVKDLCDIDSQRGRHHHRPASTADQHPSHGRRRPQTGHNTLVNRSHSHQGWFGH
jgi:hypothetical protein